MNPHIPMNDLCPIWGTAARVEPIARGVYLDHYVDSSRAGGVYKIEDTARVQIRSTSPVSETAKAKLTTMLVNRRRQGVQPLVTIDDVLSAEKFMPLPPYERADRLLGDLVDRPHKVGERLPTLFNDDRALAVSESIRYPEVQYLLGYLKEHNWIRVFNNEEIEITVAGYAKVQQQSTNLDSSQAFVAMWINPKMNSIYEKGIRPAIQDAGYREFRVDKDPKVQKIDDAIIAEIRRSRFMVADFTYGEDDGIRGSVYYEAGFAQGLGIPVVYSCRKNQIPKLHFDTRQYYHIAWEKPEDLREGLTKRILAIVGEGPHIARTL